MTRRAALVVFALVLSPILSAAPVPTQKANDLTGKWDGTFIISIAGETQDDVAFMSLVQKDKAITGTVGPTLERQWPITVGAVDGTKVTLEVQGDGPIIKFTLTLVDGRLKGDALADMNGQSMTAKVDVGRSK
jgi:hypothetical protein